MSKRRKGYRECGRIWERFGLHSGQSVSHYPKPILTSLSQVVAKDTSWYNGKGERLGGGDVFGFNIHRLIENLRGSEVFIILPKGMGIKKMLKEIRKRKELLKEGIEGNKKVKGGKVLKKTIKIIKVIGKNRGLSYSMIIIRWRQIYIVPYLGVPYLGFCRERYSNLGGNLANIISLEEAREIIKDNR